jgi:hypothetical protein
MSVYGWYEKAGMVGFITSPQRHGQIRLAWQANSLQVEDSSTLSEIQRSGWLISRMFMAVSSRAVSD